VSLDAIRKRWFEEEFWPHYWRRVDRADAIKAFSKHVRTEADKNRIVEAVKAHAPLYLGRDPEHRPHAATWLNKRRYEEPPEDTRRAADKPPYPRTPSRELPTADEYFASRGI
jgi:hypothetical protein